MGARGATAPPPYFADQLTLFQPGEDRLSPPFTTGPPFFFTIRHHYSVVVVQVDAIISRRKKERWKKIRARYLDDWRGVGTHGSIDVYLKSNSGFWCRPGHPLSKICFNFSIHLAGQLSNSFQLLRVINH